MLKVVLHTVNITSIASLVLLILLTTPTQIGRVTLFFASIFLFLVTSSTLVALHIRPADTNLFYVSLRSGILWTFFIIGVFLFGTFDTLNFITFFTFAIPFVALEVYFYAHNFIWESLKKLKKN